jgi:hypothetical protein
MRRCLLSALLCLAVLAEAESIKPFVMPSARAAGFGGIHAAQGDDFYALFSNPAALRGLKRQWSAAEINIGFYGPLFELLDLAINSSGSLNIAPLVGSGGLALGFDMGGPVVLGLVDDGFGFGVFNRTAMDARVSGNHIRPLLSEEIFLVGGYSFRVLDRDSHTVDLGFLGKGFYRISVDMKASIFDATTMFDDFMSHPYENQFGLGLDLGFRYTFADRFTLAVTGYDAFSPALLTTYPDLSSWGSGGSQSYATVEPRLSLGLLFRIRSDFLDRYISDWIVMADYRDFLDLFALIPRNPVLNVSLGMELTLLSILRLRVGIADALPSAGFGIDMKVLTLDLAIRGRELGLDPGIQSVYALDLGILFRY